MAKQIVNGIEFGSQAKVQAFAKLILYSKPVGTKLEGDSKAFMLAFFEKYHHAWDQKKGEGVLSIVIQKEPNYGKYNTFHIYRVDGTDTDISYTISSIKRKDCKREFKAALREVIKPFINEFRRKSFSQCQEIPCSITGNPCCHNTSHVDHHNPTFNQIVTSFIKENGITDFCSLIKKGRDNQTFHEINCSSTADLFYQYHAEKAVLRITTPNANLTRKRTNKTQ